MMEGVLVNYWASDASPTLGCSIEIMYVCMYVCMSSIVYGEKIVC